MKPHERLHERWRLQGFHGGIDRQSNRAVSDSKKSFEYHGWQIGGDAAVHAIETRYGLGLPGDFREHLATMPLNEEGLYDDEVVCFWSADRVESIAEGYEQYQSSTWPAPPQACLMFCDYMVSCGVLAICCEQGEHFGKVLSLDSETFLYPSFTSCVDDYLNDARAFGLRTMRG